MIEPIVIKPPIGFEPKEYIEVKHIPVKVLPNTEDWQFVMSKYRWHYHHGGLCLDSECQAVVMSVF